MDYALSPELMEWQQEVRRFVESELQPHDDDGRNQGRRAQVQFTFAPQKTASAAHFTGGPNNRTAFVGEQYGQAVWSLLDLASEWTGIVHEAFAVTKLEEMKKDITETWFVWSGPTEEGRAAYFRIQGPTVIIEYAPQSVGGDPLNHIHTLYRDPTNNYGAKWLPQP